MAIALVWTLGCSSAGSEGASFGDGETQAMTSAGSEMTGGGSSSSESAATTSSGSSSSSGGAIFDLPAPETDSGADECSVGDDLDPPGPCEIEAPPDSFEPEVQWTWTGADEPFSVVTPLVANLTDDDGNGVVDLCDVPDIVVLASAGGNLGHLYVLDGATGAEHFRIDYDVRFDSTPALGDVDGDGEIEIAVTVGPDPGTTAAVLELDGTVLWTAPAGATGGTYALADLDADGDVEVLGSRAWDHEGDLLFPTGLGGAATAADLDGDGDLEVVTGGIAYHHDGTELWNIGAASGGFPHVADLDADDEPEVLITSGNGLTLVEHDGTVTYADLRPTGVEVGHNNWNRPATIHDFDGDADAEFASASAAFYTVYEGSAAIVWSSVVEDVSGTAAGTAFDFLGDGIAEAMYADETRLFAFDGEGAVLLDVARSSTTAIEYPVVADVDNDGSAEIVVVSNQGFGGQTAPTVQVIRDREDRWVPARRIWNQHTYHVTNVREDGTIPQHEPRSWTYLNTFRTQAQREESGFCRPAG